MGQSLHQSDVALVKSLPSPFVTTVPLEYTAVVEQWVVSFHWPAGHVAVHVMHDVSDDVVPSHAAAL